jgi:hypothetical protein
MNGGVLGCHRAIRTIRLGCAHLQRTAQAIPEGQAHRATVPTCFLVSFWPHSGHGFLVQQPLYGPKYPSNIPFMQP